MRTQFVTRRTGNDTYFAVRRATGARVVVKGPFLTAKPIEAALTLNSVKSFFGGVHPLQMERVDLISDMFREDEHAFGVRNTIAKGR